MANRKTTLVQSEATELISALTARRHDYIGLDIGGSKIEIIRWKEGEILKVKRWQTPKSKEEFLDSLIKGVRGIMGETGSKSVNGVGVAMAGALDYKKGVILNSPNLKFLDGAPLAKILEEKLVCDVRMDNDTNCFLLAESRFGQAQSKKNVVALTLGTGIGGAILISGKLYRGTHGAAGELGHMIIYPHSFSPLSRGRGRGGDLEDLITRDRRDFKTIGKYLGLALANIVNIFDPEMVVLGGGVSNDAKKFLPQALREMKKYTLLPEDLQPKILVSKLEHAGSLGAVALFLE